jgi:hypothetical protein
LVAALRFRLADLGTTGETVDEIAGLPSHYTSKLLAPSHVRVLGKVSLGSLLGALGLKLVVAVDEEALAKIKHRLTPSRWSEKRRTRQRLKLMEAAAAVGQDADAQRRALMSELGRQSHAARMARTTPEERQRQASVAATARWKAARRRIREAAADVLAQC